MKKSLSAVLVILLSLIGFKSEASLIDLNVHQGMKQATGTNGGNQNEGSRKCGARTPK